VDTLLARERVWEEPDVEKVAPAKYNSLPAYPYLAARRRRVTVLTHRRGSNSSASLRRISGGW